MCSQTHHSLPPLLPIVIHKILHGAPPLLNQASTFMCTIKNPHSESLQIIRLIFSSETKAKGGHMGMKYEFVGNSWYSISMCLKDISHFRLLVVFEWYNIYVFSLYWTCFTLATYGCTCCAGMRLYTHIYLLFFNKIKINF